MIGLAQTGLQSAAALALMPFQPPAASSIAGDVDQLYYLLSAITIFFSVLIFSIIFYFMVKYRRRSEDEIPPETHTSMALELTWTIIPSLICVVLFVWASALYVRESRPPANATEIFVIGKQWMWHLQHPEGPREINELHVPVNVPVKITMTSQDVIHDFYVPAFRVKKDALPGRYTSLWFDPTEIGTYHLFCAQYCGTDHGEMIGWIYVMSAKDYAAWLAGGEKTESMAQQGERLFTQYGCIECHVAGGGGRAPSLAGLYGQPEKLASGETRVVDEALIRQAILVPNSVHVPNYQPIMPTYQGQLNEEQILDLIAYVKSLGSQERNGK
ncbi:MAG TPA: cytochrome c oxidase subunit II [Candidatus Baltobacteraceae bacterium]|nr:cytochrome c oxidase subunit II [Candidatus Baltobacteraceae bacterium]